MVRTGANISFWHPAAMFKTVGAHSMRGLWPRAASGRRRIRQYLYRHNPRIECAPTVLNIAAGCQKEIFAPVRTINTYTDRRICGVVNESSAYHKIALPLFLIVLTAGSV